MKRWRVQPASAPLRGRISVPGDKSIGHRALMFAALAEGPSVIRGLSGGLDNQATASALRAMGVQIEKRAAGEVAVAGVGLRGLKMPTAPLDCGNSGTTIRLLAGLLAPQHFGSQLGGDASLSKRPMGRVVKPLRARGAHIAGAAGIPGAKPDEVYPPLRIAPLVESEALSGLEYDMPMASAQLKSALLLSGLYAEGPTALREPYLSRDHTEHMLLALGVPLETFGPMVVLNPAGWQRAWAGFDWQVPGDFSSAAFLIAAGLMVPQSDLEIEGVGLNPTRTGLLDLLRPMRADVSLTPTGIGAGDEPMGTVRVRHAALSAGQAGGELLLRMLDEVPCLCALAACTPGTTVVTDAAELRVKESDRIAAMAAVLGAFGVDSEQAPDGIRITGASQLKGATVESRDDHRIAMSAALLGLVAEGETWVHNVDCVDTSFPGFADLLRSVGAQIEEH